MKPKTILVLLFILLFSACQQQKETKTLRLCSTAPCGPIKNTVFTASPIEATSPAEKTMTKPANYCLHRRTILLLLVGWSEIDMRNAMHI